MLDELPHEVTAIQATERWPGDRLRLTLAFPSGAVAHADLAYGTRTRERLAVHGPAARLWLDEPNMALHVRRAGAHRRRLAAHALDVATLAYRALRPSERVGRASIRGALAAFVHGVRTRGRFEPGMPQGLWNARCVAASMRSASTGRSTAIEDGSAGGSHLTTR
jgi:hypothetical protein